MKVAALGAVIVLGLAGGASGATIHTPDDGTSVTQGQSLYFDWAWDDDEYATSWIGFARSIDGPWTPRPELVVQDCSYGSCGPWLSSHATLAMTMSPGVWYWRLCNKSIYGEDDRCSYDPEAPRVVTILAPQPAPEPTPADPNRLVRCSGTARYGFFRKLSQRRTTCVKAHDVMKTWIRKAWLKRQKTKPVVQIGVYTCRFRGHDPYGRITCESPGGKFVRFYGES